MTDTPSATAFPSNEPIGPNAWLVEEMYEQYLADPASVGPSWQEFFEDYPPLGTRSRAGAHPADTSTLPAAPTTDGTAAGAPHTPAPPDAFAPIARTPLEDASQKPKVAKGDKEGTEGKEDKKAKKSKKAGQRPPEQATVGEEPPERRSAGRASGSLPTWRRASRYRPPPRTGRSPRSCSRSTVR
ncbi:MAG: hypothetical protein M5U19_12575 [Microthrixaceae bacterium]|nr:hypothetical protein [Microthrixaceae bacterium]